MPEKKKPIKRAKPRIWTHIFINEIWKIMFSHLELHTLISHRKYKNLIFLYGNICLYFNTGEIENLIFMYENMHP